MSPLRACTISREWLRSSSLKDRDTDGAISSDGMPSPSGWGGANKGDAKSVLLSSSPIDFHPPSFPTCSPRMHPDAKCRSEVRRCMAFALQARDVYRHALYDPDVLLFRDEHRSIRRPPQRWCAAYWACFRTTPHFPLLRHVDAQYRILRPCSLPWVVSSHHSTYSTSSGLLDDSSLSPRIGAAGCFPNEDKMVNVRYPYAIQRTMRVVVLRRVRVTTYYRRRRSLGTQATPERRAFPSCIDDAPPSRTCRNDRQLLRESLYSVALTILAILKTGWTSLSRAWSLRDLCPRESLYPVALAIVPIVLKAGRRTLLPPSSVSFSVLSSMVSGLFVVRWRPRTRVLHARYTKMRPDTTATPLRLSARRRPARHRSVLADDDLLGETELQAVHPITDSPTSLTHLRMRGDPARRADAAALSAGRIKSFINTSLSCGGISGRAGIHTFTLGRVKTHAALPLKLSIGDAGDIPFPSFLGNQRPRPSAPSFTAVDTSGRPHTRFPRVPVSPLDLDALACKE
ncbi:hypothetical protein C8F04DRAFT_1313090 [Mycena alexandri]|uniref:Uncharacterized protein n=1 Tax=Mycena alexandri TaxID=1745969 RepID=A0AAD6WP91_9AGAR|nr:hypothetical protein C8F04DRAFT_1313090 [Mycena alexandri]